MKEWTMRILTAAVLVLGLYVPAHAQAATIAIFPASATDPNVGTPVRPPVVYAAPTCNQPPFTETAPITNPVEGFWADPANSTRDCIVSIAPQIAALPVGTGYKGAIKIGSGLYGPFSTAFSVAAAQAHPCDTTPTSVTSVNVNQSFTLGWCHSGTNLTGWRLYRNGTLLTGVTVIAGTTNAAGDRHYSVQRTEPVAASGLIFEVSGLNSTTEGTKAAFSSLNVVALPPPPPPAPATPTRTRTTVP